MSRAATAAAGDVLHETTRRLRVASGAVSDAATLRDALRQLPGVESVRVNAAARCVVVHYDGTPAARAAVIERVRAARMPATE